MQIDTIITTLSIIGFTSTVFYAMFRVSKFAFLLNLVILLAVVFFFSQGNQMVSIVLYLVCPLILINTLQKWGRKACLAIICKKHGPLLEKHFSSAQKIHVQLLA